MNIILALKEILGDNSGKNTRPFDLKYKEECLEKSQSLKKIQGLRGKRMGTSFRDALGKNKKT